MVLRPIVLNRALLTLLMRISLIEAVIHLNDILLLICGGIILLLGRIWFIDMNLVS